jgi:cobaltochelatase CobS
VVDRITTVYRGCGHMHTQLAEPGDKSPDPADDCPLCKKLKFGNKGHSESGLQEPPPELRQLAQQAAQDEEKEDNSEEDDSMEADTPTASGGEDTGEDRPAMMSDVTAGDEKVRAQAKKAWGQLSFSHKALVKKVVALDDLAAMLYKRVQESSGLNEAKVRALVEEIAASTRTVVVRETAQGPEKAFEGNAHRQFPLLLQLCQARLFDGHRLNVWIKGPAGSGKTTAARQVAQSLGIGEFRFNGAIDTEYKLRGFCDAQGRIVQTAFRQVWTDGGVYLFDEVDASLPPAVLAFNAALANASCDFPDGPVERHKDCVILAAANTWGGGATSDYVGRAKQDAAFLDRFVSLHWEIDERLEAALCSDAAWAKRVQAVRKNVLQRGIKGVIISPRATVFGDALLAAGLERKLVEELCLRKGMSTETWDQVGST